MSRQYREPGGARVVDRFHKLDGSATQLKQQLEEAGHNLREYKRWRTRWVDLDGRQKTKTLPGRRMPSASPTRPMPPSSGMSTSMQGKVGRQFSRSTRSGSPRRVSATRPGTPENRLGRITYLASGETVQCRRSKTWRYRPGWRRSSVREQVGQYSSRLWPCSASFLDTRSRRDGL